MQELKRLVVNINNQVGCQESVKLNDAVECQELVDNAVDVVSKFVERVSSAKVHSDNQLAE